MASFNLRVIDGVTVIETTCVAGCDRIYAVDERSPDFVCIKAELEAGDRSGIRCYHGPALDENSRKSTLRDSPAAKRRKP